MRRRRSRRRKFLATLPTPPEGVTVYAREKPAAFKAWCAWYRATRNKTFLRLANTHRATLAPTEWPPFRSSTGERDL